MTCLAELPCLPTAPKGRYRRLYSVFVTNIVLTPVRTASTRLPEPSGIVTVPPSMVTEMSAWSGDAVP